MDTRNPRLILLASLILFFHGICSSADKQVYEWPIKGGNTGWTGFSPDPSVKPPFRLKWAAQPGRMAGHATGLAVGGGKVYTREGCLDAETGEVLWQTPLKMGGTYYQGRLYVGSKGSVYVYDVATGKQVWRKTGCITPYSNKAGLTVHDGMIYAGRIADHEGKPFYFLRALKTEDGSELWATPLIASPGKKTKPSTALVVGMSGAAVAGGRVFISTHHPAMIFALDRKTGKVLWSQTDVAAKNSPGSDGKTVWASEAVQGIWALNAATGKKLWHWGGSKETPHRASYAMLGTSRYPPTAAYSKLFASNYGRNFMVIDPKTGKELAVAGAVKGEERGYNIWSGGCGPPTAASGYLYTNGVQGKDFNGPRLRYSLYAIDPETLKPVWRHPLSSKSCGRSPIAYGRVYCVTKNEVYCFEPLNGKKPDEPQPPPSEPASALTAMAKPFVGKAGEAGAGEKPAGGADWPMYGGCPARCGTDVKIGLPIKEAWKFDTGAKVRSSPVIAGGVVYAGNDGGEMFALDLKSGQKKWSTKITRPPEKDPILKWIRSAPAVANGIVVCGADDGLMRAFDAAGGKLKWKFSTASQIRSSPAIVGDRVVFGSWDGRCYCVRLSDGKEFWRYRVDEPGVRVHAPVTVAAGRVYIGAWEAFSIHGLDLGTGKPPAGYSNYSPTRGTKSPKLGLVQGMAVYRGLLVTASQKGSGSTLDANTGKLLASVHGMGSQLPTLPAFSGGKVYYQASPHGTALVDVLSKAKYKRKKSYKGQVGDAPLIGGNIMMVGTTAGGLHAYQLPDEGVDEPAKQVWQWKSQSGKEIQTAPAAGSGFIVIGSDDGCVYAFSYSKEVE